LHSIPELDAQKGNTAVTEPTGVKAAVIYVRSARNEQGSKTSLIRQERTCRDYCEQKGLRVVRVFTGIGESGRGTDRPALSEMLRYCKEHQGGIQFLVMSDVSRLSRNVADHITMVATLRRWGVSIRSAAEPLGDSLAERFAKVTLKTFEQVQVGFDR
jgi:site-specific DNA recombinase